MIDKSGEEPPAGALLSLLSRLGPEVPPDVANAPVEPRRRPHPVEEPTQTLPLVAARRAPPPRVAARAVIVYEPQQRRSWGLWAFAAMLVALTVGVVLGQAVADQPASRSAAGTVPTGGVVPAVTSGPSSGPAAPAPAVLSRPLTAPLGTARTRVFEVTGASTVLHVRSAKLGDALYRVTTTGSGAVPKLVGTARGPRLELTRTRGAGVQGVDIQLNAEVSWTIRLAGRSSEQDVDMRAGGLAGVELTGGALSAVLQLPVPKGTVPLSVTDTVRQLIVHAQIGTPVRLRLSAGAGAATVDGVTYRNVKTGTVLTPAGWQSAGNRYDVAISAAVSSASVDHR